MEMEKALMPGQQVRNIPSPSVSLRVLAACMVLALMLGSIHAFSVLLMPLEEKFGVSRSIAGMTYSLALVCLTLGVMSGHRLYGLVRPPVLMAVICAMGGVGCAGASTVGDIAVVWLGYSILFGFANGLGYGFALQYAGQANPGRVGLAMGLVTAAYGLGAFLSPMPMTWLLNLHGLGAVFHLLGAGMALAGLLSLILLFHIPLNYRAATPDEAALNQPGKPELFLLWLGFGSAVGAGLMAMAHATGIADAGGLPEDKVMMAPMAIASANMACGLLAGWLADRFCARKLMILIAGSSVIALAVMAYFPGGMVVLAGLMAVGGAYGAMIVVYPAMLSRRYGAVAGARLYGLVFTAWGISGLLAPLLAGLLFDHTGNYGSALLVAAGFAVISAGLAARKPGKEPGGCSS